MKSLLFVVALCGPLVCALPIGPEDEHISDKDMAFAKLQVTGKADSTTLDVVRKSRCGVIDMDEFKHIPHFPKWEKKDITYSIENYTPHMDSEDVDEEIEKAVKLWSDVTPLTFTRVYDDSADIKIFFDVGGRHCEWHPLHGQVCDLAYATEPPKPEIHFNDDQSWTKGKGYRLSITAAHEIGHTLGLAHSDVPGALMSKFYENITLTNSRLPQDDIDGAQELYPVTHLSVYDNDDKIIGGFECPAHSQPWQVLFTNSSMYQTCGGSLINERWIISAAHCYESPENLIAHLGEHDITLVEGMEQRIQVEKAICYPEYNSFTFDHDLMLVKLAKPAQFNAFVQPVKVSQKCPVAGTSCLVSGWGYIRTTWDETPDKLQCLKVPILSTSQCKLSYPGEITSNMFCAGYTEGGKDACKGDSGGPLVCNRELTGVVSWGVGCALKNKPGVYTTVCNYKAWIDKVLANN